MKLTLIPSNNNKIFKINIFAKNFILKFYTNTKHKDLFQNEIFFYKNFLSLQNTFIPKKYLSNSFFRIGIFKFYLLQKVENLTHTDIDICCRFIFQINKNIQEYKYSAIEACFKPIDHIKAPLNKIKNLKKKLIKNSFYYNEVLILQKKYIQLYWNFKKKGTNFNLYKQYPKNRFIISPSDFGFHNIFRINDNLFFLDFEHSGLDDICKLICDFYFFPANNFNSDFKNYFKENLIHHFINIDEIQLNYEIDIFLPFYKIKWETIILNKQING